jgi:NAD(P)-dependent dehydrogenase (short-subunit alcohol dehydrogenase family)
VAELEGKAALVTGAGVGIGRAIAIKLASEGARVLVVDLNEATAQDTADAIRKAGGEAAVFTADVSDEDRVTAMVKTAVDTFGSLDVACNSAAVSRGSGPIHTFDKAVFDQTLDLCLTNTFLCMKHEIEAMLGQASGGSIVNISSNASLRGPALQYGLCRC